MKRRPWANIWIRIREVTNPSFSMDWAESAEKGWIRIKKIREGQYPSLPLGFFLDFARHWNVATSYMLCLISSTGQCSNKNNSGAMARSGKSPVWHWGSDASPTSWATSATSSLSSFSSLSFSSSSSSSFSPSFFLCWQHPSYLAFFLQLDLLPWVWIRSYCVHSVIYFIRQGRPCLLDS